MKILFDKVFIVRIWKYVLLDQNIETLYDDDFRCYVELRVCSKL